MTNDMVKAKARDTFSDAVFISKNGLHESQALEISEKVWSKEYLPSPEEDQD